MVDWNAVDTVFLDMDGTLLDLHFDNHFWREHVPRHYAAAHGLPWRLATVRAELLTRYRRREGTLAWYCVEHWSRELALDIAFLKQEVSHLIAMHPQVVDFLEALTALGKRRVLVTNAHSGPEYKPSSRSPRTHLLNRRQPTGAGGGKELRLSSAVGGVCTGLPSTRPGSRAEFPAVSYCADLLPSMGTGLDIARSLTR